jgi:hypothetical protein
MRCLSPVLQILECHAFPPVTNIPICQDMTEKADSIIIGQPEWWGGILMNLMRLVA